MSKGFVYGLIMAAGLVAYFLLMKLLGLETNFYLRIFNFIILIAGVYFLMRNEIVRSTQSVTYFEGLGLGLRATVSSVIVFLIFLAGYINFFDPEFMQILKESEIWGTDITLSQAVTGILIEGIASSVVISFAWMQYFKKYTVSPNASLNI
ncbi:DUF4199 domain-containing protein [Cryomorphaceae bacterium 1068]|nr:DUF4199 domain-containing protein [Cryomorphaceae bacterium 1068]